MAVPAPDAVVSTKAARTLAQDKIPSSTGAAIGSPRRSSCGKEQPRHRWSSHAIAAAFHGGCCTKGSEELWNLTGGRLVAIYRSDWGRLPLAGHFQPSWHGSSHHRSTHRICGWFVRQPPCKAAAWSATAV